MTAPDRIIADCGFVPAENAVATFASWDKLTEYVRADLARPTPLAEALAAAQAYIEDLEAHEGAEGFSTSTAKLGAAYYAALRAIGENKA